MRPRDAHKDVQVDKGGVIECSIGDRAMEFYWFFTFSHVFTYRLELIGIFGNLVELKIKSCIDGTECCSKEKSRKVYDDVVSWLGYLSCEKLALSI